MKNSHCIECKERTKLFLKLPGRMNYTYMCEKAKTCPFTEQEAKQ